MVLNRDRFLSADELEVGHAVAGIMSALDRHPPEIKLHALCAAFLEMATAAKVPAGDVFTATKNLINDEQYSRRPYIRAVRQYVNEEIVKA